MQNLSVSGTPTASIVTSAPRPSVSSLILSIASSGPMALSAPELPGELLSCWGDIDGNYVGRRVRAPRRWRSPTDPRRLYHSVADTRCMNAPPRLPCRREYVGR